MAVGNNDGSSGLRRQARKMAQPEQEAAEAGGDPYQAVHIRDNKPKELPHRFNTTDCDDPTTAQSPMPAEFQDDAKLEELMGQQAQEGIAQSGDTDDSADGEASGRIRA